MEKLNVVLVLLNKEYLKSTLRCLNFNNANIVAVVIENGDGKAFNLGNKQIQCVSFSSIQGLLNSGKDLVWLINGWVKGIGDIWKTKKFLMNNGVPEDNIVNFEILNHMSAEWLANLRYIEEYGADFFATSISYTEVGLNFNCIPHAPGRGVNLASSNQDLRQGYLTAKHVFEHVAPGTIKFVLIGLTPYSFRYDNRKAFSVCSRNFQYMLALESSETKTLHDLLLLNLVGDNIKNNFLATTNRQADLNYDNLKITANKELPARALVSWEDELKNLTKKLFPEVVEENLQILKDYIKLCLDNGAKPIGVVFPFAPAMRKNYSAELLTMFRLFIRQLEESYDFTCIDLFDLELGYECFYNMAHLNLRGSSIASAVLGIKLYENNLVPEENFCNMNYGYFNLLSELLLKDDYNSIMDRVFKRSIELIRRKPKIKVGFVLYDSSMWCGDELYNFFDDDPRFEPTIFLCLRRDTADDKLVRRDFLNGVEQFRSRALNVIPIAEKDFEPPAQDVLIFLTPYLEVLPNAFQFSRLTARTLVTYIPYGFSMSVWNMYNIPIYHVGWKFFFDTLFYVALLEKECTTGMPRGIYSGYSRMDIFFKKDTDFKFDWKMTRPDAKKIIWAPHWSITGGINYATFQWNCQFMYEFAKAHPEISWVVKPHPNLLFSAVSSGLFPSVEAFENYLHDWDNLPNAKVVTGGYYQSVFATSDGMIHDSSSFIGEYQYTDKPMIFLRRETQEFNEQGIEILNASYLVDGRDLDGIASLMQRVFIEGDDYKAAERRMVFDKYFNYPKVNGMLASEFIYRSIANEFI